MIYVDDVPSFVASLVGVVVLAATATWLLEESVCSFFFEFVVTAAMLPALVHHSFHTARRRRLSGCLGDVDVQNKLGLSAEALIPQQCDRLDDSVASTHVSESGLGCRDGGDGGDTGFPREGVLDFPSPCGQQAHLVPGPSLVLLKALDSAAAESSVRPSLPQTVAEKSCEFCAYYNDICTYCKDAFALPPSEVWADDWDSSCAETWEADEYEWWSWQDDYSWEVVESASQEDEGHHLEQDAYVLCSQSEATLSQDAVDFDEKSSNDSTVHDVNVDESESKEVKIKSSLPGGGSLPHYDVVMSLLDTVKAPGCPPWRKARKCSSPRCHPWRRARMCAVQAG